MARSLGGNTVTDRHGRELIAHGSVQFPVACYENDMSEKTVPWHWHDDWEVIAVEKGAAMFAAGSDRYVIREGQGLFINGGVLHGIWDMENSGCRFISIVYHPRLVGGSADSIFWQRYVQPILSDAGRSLPAAVPDPEEPSCKSARSFQKGTEKRGKNQGYAELYPGALQ